MSCALEEAIQLLQCHAAEGIEFSLCTASDAVGVLVPVTQWDGFLAFWKLWCTHFNESPMNRASFDCMMPRFLRCDFNHAGWQALTFYGDLESSHAPMGDWPAPMPIFISSVRFQPSAKPELATYYDGKSLTYEKFSANLSYASARRGFTQETRARISATHGRLAQLGWMQALAITTQPHRMKLDVATRRTTDTIRVIAQWEPANSERIRRAVQFLGDVIGYAGASMADGMPIAWRVYSRPMLCRNIREIVEKLLR